MKKERITKRSKSFSNLPIGIFDSGIGGLTVLKAIMKKLPNENLIYFGDTARLPYGTKSSSAVKAYSLEIARFLVRKKAKIIVVACNTASSNALEFLKKRIRLPIVGVVLPGVRYALSKAGERKFGVIGTEATIKSESYKRMLNKFSDIPIKVYQRACPLFVPLVEEGWLNNKIARDTVSFYLKNFKSLKLDVLILGCTHYPLLKDLIRKVLGPEILIVDSAKAAAEEVAALLKQKGISASRKIRGSRTYYVTDSPEKFKQLARAFLVEPVRKIKLVRF